MIVKTKKEARRYRHTDILLRVLCRERYTVGDGFNKSGGA